MNTASWRREPEWEKCFFNIPKSQSQGVFCKFESNFKIVQLYWYTLYFIIFCFVILFPVVVSLVRIYNLALEICLLSLLWWCYDDVTLAFIKLYFNYAVTSICWVILFLSRIRFPPGKSLVHTWPRQNLCWKFCEVMWTMPG